MTKNILDQLLAVTPAQLKLLRTLNEVGAASSDELAIKLNRAGEDITPDIQNLLGHNLLQTKTMGSGGEKVELFLTARDIRAIL